MVKVKRFSWEANTIRINVYNNIGYVEHNTVAKKKQGEAHIFEVSQERTNLLPYH